MHNGLVGHTVGGTLKGPEVHMTYSMSRGCGSQVPAGQLYSNLGCHHHSKLHRRDTTSTEKKNVLLTTTCERKSSNNAPTLTKMVTP